MRNMSKSTFTSHKAGWLRRGVPCLLVLGCVGAMMPLVQRAGSQRAAVRAIEDLGGSVMYDFEMQGRAEPPGPRWLRSLIGDDYFARVEIVMLWDPSTGDRHLEPVRELKHVKKLYLTGTQITDAAVPLLEQMQTLEILSLRDTLVSENAKSRLERKLPRCLIR